MSNSTVETFTGCDWRVRGGIRNWHNRTNERLDNSIAGGSLAIPDMHPNAHMDLQNVESTMFRRCIQYTPMESEKEREVNGWGIRGSHESANSFWLIAAGFFVIVAVCCGATGVQVLLGKARWDRYKIQDLDVIIIMGCRSRAGAIEHGSQNRWEWHFTIADSFRAVRAFLQVISHALFDISREHVLVPARHDQMKSQIGSVNWNNKLE